MIRNELPPPVPPVPPGTLVLVPGITNWPPTEVAEVVELGANDARAPNCPRLSPEELSAE